MADVEEPQFTTLQERIAALNKQKNFQAPPSTVGKRAPPPPPSNRPASTAPVRSSATTPATSDVVVAQKSPSLPPRPSRANTQKAPPPLPHRSTNFENGKAATPPALPGRNLAPPPLPSRSSQQQVSPALPPRQPSAQTLSVRRNSNSSDVSYISAVSNLSLTQASSPATSVGGEVQPLRKLPPMLSDARLPALPPSRREIEAKAQQAVEKEAVSQLTAHLRKTPLALPRPTPSSRATEPPRPSLPPRLPSRPARPAAAQDDEEQAPALPARRLPPRSASQPLKSALQSGFGTRSRPTDDTPPPVPTSSRPTLPKGGGSAVTHPAASASPPGAGDCLLCRDFSGPDDVAAQYPAQSLPRRDTIGYLAHVLCDPFPSHTDKARALFTWMHHNIAYNVKDFMAGTIPRGETPEETIFSGKAVCAGYAGVYETIAVRAGMKCLMVTGHGKGFGHNSVKAGERPPPRNATGHAWNAVQIDGGAWKLIDACWGAGYIDPEKYTAKFNAKFFCMSNIDFGLSHFPENDAHFYREDGRVPTWEEYVLGPEKGERATWSGDAGDDGLSEATFEPRAKHISVHGGDVLRFQFSKVCEHWDPVKNGKGPARLLMLQIHGQGASKTDFVVLESDGFWWWVDIHARDLGNPGQSVTLCGLDTLDGRNARGVQKEDFLRKKGRCSMSWVCYGVWELV